MKIPQRSRYTPSRSDVGKPVEYIPESEQGVLTDVQGIFATVRFRGKRGKYYGTCDVRNLRLVRVSKVRK